MIEIRSADRWRSASRLAFCLGLAVLVPTAAYSDDVDNLLEQLEKRLDGIDDASLGVDYQSLEKKRFRVKDSAGTVSGSSRITASPGERSNLEDIEAAIAKLASEIDVLHADIQKTQSRLQDASDFDSLAQVFLEIPRDIASQVKAASVKIDGYEIFNRDDSTGFGVARDLIPIFEGVLQSGDHHFDVSLHFAQKTKGGLQFEGDAFKIVQERFSISVGARSFRKKLVFKVSPGAHPHGRATIDMAATGLGSKNVK